MVLKIKLPILSWLILIILMITWGSSFILIKKGLTVFNSMQIGAMRISITFLVLLPFAIHRIKYLRKKHWLLLSIIGFCGAIPAFLFPLAQVHIDSAIAGILNSTTPLFTLIIGVLFFSLKVKWYNISGVMIGLIGTIGLISVSGGGNFNFNFSFAIYIIIATIFYALNGNLIKYFLNDLDAFTITIFSFFVFGIPALLYLFIFTDFFSKITTHPYFWEGLTYVSVLAIFGTAAALIAFNYLIKITNAVFASSVTYLIPIVALIWGIIDGEIFKPIYTFFILSIFVGIYLVNTKKIFIVKRK